MTVVIAAAILCVLSPVGDVYFSRTGYHKLQLPSIKDRNESWIDDLIKAPDKRFGLLLNASLQPPLDDSLQILFLILLVDSDVFAAGLQLLFDNPSEKLLGDAKSQSKRVAGSNVIVTNPLQ
jgi:hypothetical protein